MFVIFLLLIILNRGVCMDPLILDLLTPNKHLGEQCGYESCETTVDGWTNIHIVPYSHVELGYMKTFYEYYNGEDEVFDKSRINVKRIFDATISELWSNKARKFTIADTELPYFFYWWAHREGTVRRMVYELIRQGRLVIVGGGWGMQDEASSYYQTIIDSYTYSLRKINSTFLTCGRPHVAWQADSFGHSREYASLLSLMGFDGLFINPISFDDELIRMERKGLEFLWRGSDDLGPESDIYTHKLFDGYWSAPGFCFSSTCSDPLLVTSDSLFKNVEERAELFINAVRYRQAPNYNTKQVMMIMGQRMGYFDAKMWFANVDTLIHYVNKRSHAGGYKMIAKYSNPMCFLKAVFEENPILDTKQDDFFPFAYDKDTYMTGMYTSRPSLKYLVRQANIFLQIAKQLQVLANLGNNDVFFEEFMWIMGVVQDHNIISGAMRPHVKNYYTTVLHDSLQNSVKLLNQGFNKIRSISVRNGYILCHLNESSCPSTVAPPFHIIVYNPLAWSVTMPIRLPIGEGKFHVFDPSGKTITSALMRIPEHVLKIPKRFAGHKHELVFIAPKLPAMGFRSYFIDISKTIERKKRSLIKKISKNQQKKYFIRQIPKSENETVFEEQDYDYFDQKPDSKIEFGNISRLRESENEYEVITPRKEIVTEDVTKTSEQIRTSEIFTTTSKTTSTTTSTTETIVTKKRVVESSKEVKKQSMQIEESKDDFIKNQYIQINLDKHRKVSSIFLSNGVKTALDIQYYYYISDDPDKLNSKKRRPGAFVFRPLDIKPEAIIDYIDTRVYKSDVVEEIHSRYSDYASFSIKLYRESVVCEIDWTIGPIPAEDGLGKEVFIRYTMDLENDGVFYTDANGRQMVKRIRHTRAMYDPYNLDPVAGNFYPVTSRIYIEDLNKNVRLSIFNDRSQGGTSLLDGSIDLMVNRQIFTDDSGVNALLNETENGEGIIVRGIHYLYLTKADFKSNRIFEKKLAKEVELKPQILFSDRNEIIQEREWSRSKNEFSSIKAKLPIGIHILTIQEWNEKCLLIRFENYLEKVDVIRDGVKVVYLENVFLNIRPYKIVEMTLAGNMLLEEWMPLQWQKNESFVSNFNYFYGNNNKITYSKDALKPLQTVDVDKGLVLHPQQIRTFVVSYTYN